jgi:acetyl-CoA carboxylase biotin carboxyl carrier protein
MNDRIDFEQVREVIRIAEASDLVELEVETPSLKVRVRREVAASPAGGRSATPTTEAQPAAAPAAVAPQAAAQAPAHGAGQDHLEPIIAPMVGTFYRASSPDAAPLVSVGDYIDEGQVVCIIEAMKLFNEIQAERAGRLTRVLVDNATPVEYGQPLFLLDPTATRA